MNFVARAAPRLAVMRPSIESSARTESIAVTDASVMDATSGVARVAGAGTPSGFAAEHADRITANTIKPVFFMKEFIVPLP
jgi:hypothetical protein